MELMRDDERKICCPYCREEDGLHFAVIPENGRLTYTYDDEDGVATETTDHLGEVRDYKCLNCDMEFLVPVGVLDSMA